jgi:osmotically-inducible protein OsmY
MTLNTDRVPVELCVEAVCQLAEHPKFRGDPAMTNSALVDKLLEAKINSALTEHVGLDKAPLGISATVADGNVMLVGTSRIASVRDKAEKVARAIAGMREIDNRISVPSW